MKLTKTKLKQIIKEEANKILSEGMRIDPGEFYLISGENIIALRGMANELLMSNNTIPTARSMHVLLTDPNIRPLEVQGKEWVDEHVARIQNHLDEKHTEGRGMLMELVNRLARAAKGEQS